MEYHLLMLCVVYTCDQDNRIEKLIMSLCQFHFMATLSHSQLVLILIVINVQNTFSHT